MAGHVQVRAGWGGEILRNASPQLQARAQLADLEYEQERERQARERQILGEDLEASSVALSVRMEEQRGGLITPHERIHGIGRTKAEALEYHSALGDVEDLRRAAAAQKLLNQFLERQAASWGGDLTAPSEEEQAADEELLARGRAARLQNMRDLRNQGYAVEEARRLAAIDRRAERMNGERGWT